MSDGWPPTPAEVWLATSSEGAAVRAYTSEGELAIMLLLRLVSERNLDGMADDRTFALDLDQAVALITGLMADGFDAFGREVVMSAMAGHLGIRPDLRDRTRAAFDAAFDEYNG